jgi:hypothetical protein
MKIMHMSQGDYTSLGETLMRVMNNYLPSEQTKLQFISGKILDVFYDEFVKFIPPYILKREEEKRKQLERNQGSIQPLNISVGPSQRRPSRMNYVLPQSSSKLNFQANE